MAEIKAVEMFKKLVKAHENKEYLFWTHYFFMYKSSTFPFILDSLPPIESFQGSV
jgi:hypothetical protein